MQVIDCKRYAQEILDEVKAAPNKKKLIIFTAGDNPASASYVKGKIKDCEYCGIPYEHIKVETPDELETLIRQKCMAATTGGIIIQLPLPDGWDEEYFTNLVPPALDVDGFVNGSKFKPCTPEGIMYLLKKELGNLSGKSALIIGRGKLVGKPLTQMLIDEDCTVTVAHSKTRSLDDLLAEYHDIVVTAVGRPLLIDLLDTNARVVIDAGISKDKKGKLRGDCFFFSDDFAPNMKVTPVPGGVGLMTRAMLMKHMVDI
jgi:methylenetetrahydrofolate dehydrogenase (NADP+)/methenyltetrahydrofolate cyclohydrolase